MRAEDREVDPLQFPYSIQKLLDSGTMHEANRSRSRRRWGPRLRLRSIWTEDRKKPPVVSIGGTLGGGD
jgi:hypothetical protein